MPPEPVTVSKAQKIIDFKKYINTQKAVLENNMKNPFVMVFYNSYIRLYELKKAIEK